MNPTCNWKAVLLGSACVSILSALTAKITHILTASKQCNDINEVLLYGAGEESKRKQLGLNNLYCIYHVLVHATLTIDVCVPSLNSETITKCLINVQQERKTKVRIVVHRNPESNLRRLQNCGLEVKVLNNAEVRLGHDFILIDAVGDCEEALAIVGSIDYEKKYVNCNSDSTLLTSDKNVVSTFKREFDRIWNSAVDAE